MRDPTSPATHIYPHCIATSLFTGPALRLMPHQFSPNSFGASEYREVGTEDVPLRGCRSGGPECSNPDGHPHPLRWRCIQLLSPQPPFIVSNCTAPVELAISKEVPTRDPKSAGQEIDIDNSDDEDALSRAFSSILSRMNGRRPPTSVPPPLPPPPLPASHDPSGRHPGGNPGANLKSISHRCQLILVAFVWELTKEIINWPLGCLQGGGDFLRNPTESNRA